MSSGHSQFALLRQRRFLPFFVVQALGAFNDNVYRQAIIGLLFWLGVSPAERTLYTNLAPALFILPYFLFSATAGQIAEKLEKQTLIVITTTMEIAIMSLAALGFLLQNLPLLLVALFCTGLQSTLFGPTKYSILPAVLKPEELTGGNGLVEMGTSVSILCGMLAGGLIFQLAGSHGPVVAATAVVALALAGNAVARRIPRVAAGDPSLTVRWNPLPESLAILRLTRRQPAVRNAVFGVSWFWFVGTVLTAQLPTYAVANLGGQQALYVFALALFSIGTGTGSLLCERLSARTVEIGLVPLGAFGISAFMLDLYFARPGQALAAGLSIGAFVHQTGSLRIIADLLGIGVFTGFFVVPLFALIQSRTPREQLSRVIAGVNIQNALFIVAAAVVGIALQMPALNLFGHALPMPGLSIPQVFLLLAIANALVTLWIFLLVPEFLMRFASWLLVGLLYRLRPRGIEEHVPDAGPALLVCNHVSSMDALILAGCIPRPVRFVIDCQSFRLPLLGWLLRTAGAIPIADATEDPALMRRAFERIDAALAAGELVCLFPEGAPTRDGRIAPFRSGVETILERCRDAGRPVPVVPLALRGLWASLWSQHAAELRLPRRLRARVEVVAGKPLDGTGTLSAADLHAQVCALRGDQA